MKTFIQHQPLTDAELELLGGPDGLGKPGGGDDPELPNPQAVKVPANIPRRKK